MNSRRDSPRIAPGRPGPGGRGGRHASIQREALMSKANIANVAVVLLSLAAAAGAHEQQQEEKEKGPWEGKASFGYLASSGNSESLSVNAAAEVAYTAGRWRHVAEVSALGAQDDTDTTAEAYEAGWKSELSLGEFSYVFGNLRWQKDKFSGYDQQITESLGYGRRFVNGERHILNGEAGLGARQSDLRDGTSESELILRGALDYRWRFSDTARFDQDFTVESGAENTYMESVSALRANVLEAFALVLSYTVRRNTEVPAGSEKTDTFTAISLEYTF